MDEGEGASVEGLEPENQSEPEASSASDDVPDITALKKEIEQLEQDLKTKKSSLMYAQDQVEEYSKAGYARAVAEMENMRRVRLVSSNETVTVVILEPASAVSHPHRFYNNPSEQTNKFTDHEFFKSVKCNGWDFEKLPSPLRPIGNHERKVCQ